MKTPIPEIRRPDTRRRHTEAESRLVAAVFRCSVATAREILCEHPSQETLAKVRGMLDALEI